MDGVGIQVDKIVYQMSGMTEKLDEMWKGKCADILCNHYINPPMDLASQAGYNINY